MRFTNKIKLSKEESFVLIVLPIINGLALVSTGFFKEQYGGIDLGFTPGNVRAVILCLFLGYFYFFNRVKSHLSFLINTLAVFIIFSTLYSADFVNSIPIAIKFFLWSAFFGVGYYYMNTIEKLLIYTRYYIIALLMVFISLIIANVYDLGLGIYESGYRAGAAGISVVLILTHVFFFIPLFQHFNKNRLFNFLAYLLMTLSFIFIAVSTKRGAIFGLVFGYIIYLFLTPRKSSKLFLRTAPFLILIFIIISLFLKDLIVEIYTERAVRYQLQYEENLEQEARYYEIITTTENAFKSMQSFLIGNGFFSEISKKSERYIGGRQNHIDYFSILHGTGFIGLGLYLFIVFYAIRTFNKFKKLNNSYISSEFFAIVTGSLVCLSILAFSSTITSIDYRIFIYFFYGGILRIMEREYKLKLAQS